MIYWHCSQSLFSWCWNISEGVNCLASKCQGHALHIQKSSLPSSFYDVCRLTCLIKGSGEYGASVPAKSSLHFFPGFFDYSFLVGVFVLSKWRTRCHKNAWDIPIIDVLSFFSRLDVNFLFPMNIILSIIFLDEKFCLTIIFSLRSSCRPIQ